MRRFHVKKPAFPNKYFPCNPFNNNFFTFFFYLKSPHYPIQKKNVKKLLLNGLHGKYLFGNAVSI